MTESTMPDSPLASTTPDGPPLPGVFARVIGVITSPGETFAHIVRTPKVAGALAIVVLLMAAATAVPQFTERGKDMALDLQVSQIEQRGQPITDQQLAVMQQMRPLMPYFTLATMMIFMPLMAVITSAVLWAVFNTVLGGTGTFKQVMAIVTHSQIITALGTLVAAPIMYSRGVLSQTGVANLGALIPSLDESSVVGRVLRMLDFFAIWWVIVLAIGLAALYKRGTTGIAVGLFVFYLLLLIGIASFFG